MHLFENGYHNAQHIYKKQLIPLIQKQGNQNIYMAFLNARGEHEFRMQFFIIYNTYKYNLSLKVYKSFKVKNC